MRRFSLRSCGTRLLLAQSQRFLLAFLPILSLLITSVPAFAQAPSRLQPKLVNLMTSDTQYVTRNTLCTSSISANDLSWQPLFALSARTRQSAVWTGAERIIWGGHAVNATSGDTFFNDGACYDPTTNLWTPITSTNFMSSRQIPLSSTVTLQPSWNLRGLPHQTATSVGSAFSSVPVVDQVMLYRNSNWLVATLNTPVYPGNGLWVHVAGASPVTWVVYDN